MTICARLDDIQDKGASWIFTPLARSSNRKIRRPSVETRPSYLLATAAAFEAQVRNMMSTGRRAARRREGSHRFAYDQKHIQQTLVDRLPLASGCWKDEARKSVKRDEDKVCHMAI
ncbi:uncharacterized protein LOC111269993 isoform X2 [Varroa jacobsoni]|uniref:uncharacterized protein LOC111269993 isoform X2 n=1 Tax=Varroa jacobsoni TaxID=62625 RepID=UPI000BF633CB|nr:uncharacterized protein LOC111269993 isoform X2 [Varroa jacobsoni]